MGGDYL